jgi:Domain of unknown function (DUF4333)
VGVPATPRTGQEARSFREVRGATLVADTSTQETTMSQPLTYADPSAPAPQRRSSTGKIVTIVIAAVVVLGGLATAALFLLAKPVLDEAKVQAEIVRITRDASGLEPTNGVCPPNVPVHAGDVTTCTAQLDGQPVTYAVRQDDDKGRPAHRHRGHRELR